MRNFPRTLRALVSELSWRPPFNLDFITARGVYTILSTVTPYIQRPSRAGFLHALASQQVCCRVTCSSRQQCTSMQNLCRFSVPDLGQKFSEVSRALETPCIGPADRAKRRAGTVAVCRGPPDDRADMTTIRTGLPVDGTLLNKSAPFSEPALKMPGCATFALRSKQC